MAGLKLFFNLLLALPEIYKIFMRLWDIYRQDQKIKEEKKRQAAFDAMKNANSVEEVKNASKDITSNLP